jgi:hypothetical protein
MHQRQIDNLLAAAKETGDLRFNDAAHCIGSLRRELADANSEIDQAWDAFGSRGGRAHLTLPERITTLMREVDESDEARRELDEARRTIETIERLIPNRHDYRSLADAVEAALRLARKGLG